MLIHINLPSKLETFDRGGNLTKLRSKYLETDYDCLHGLIKNE